MGERVYLIRESYREERQAYVIARSREEAIDKLLDHDESAIISDELIPGEIIMQPRAIWDREATEHLRRNEGGA